MLKAYVFIEDHYGSKKGDIGKLGPESSFKPCHLENSKIVKRVDAPCDDPELMSYNFSSGKLEMDQSKIRKVKLIELRQARDKKLKDVDSFKRDIEFAEYTNSPKSSEYKSKVAQYRKSLLDITEPYKQNPALLDNINIEVVLPVKDF